MSDTKKSDLIVLTGAGGFIAGSLVRYFKDKGFTRIRAVDKKPLPDWYQVVEGVESLSLDVSQEENAIASAKGPPRSTTWRPTWAAWASSSASAWSASAAILINTHMIEAAWRAGCQRYFFSSSACAYNTELAEGSQRPGAEGSGRLSGHGGAGLRLGEADLGDVLPGVLGGARPEDPHRPLPQRLRPERHLGRRPGKGPGGHLPQGDRGQGARQA